jgi:hypothetical protein
MTKFIVTHFSNGHFEDVEIEADWFEVQNHKELMFFTLVEACEEEHTVALFAEHRWTRVRRIEDGQCIPRSKAACFETMDSYRHKARTLEKLEQVASMFAAGKLSTNAVDLYLLCSNASTLLTGIIDALRDD